MSKIDIGLCAADDFQFAGVIIILVAAAANMQLGGLVAYFLLDQDAQGGSNIKGPVELSYGSEDSKLGLVVYWQVKEHIESEVVISS